MEGMMAETLTETTPATTAIDWLSPLEDKVRAAAERIRSLNEENAALRRQVSELEEQLATASTAAAAAPSDLGAAQWDAERWEIRERVERLTQHLEELAGV
jgi:cell division septum initiation protein DivIVA